MVQYRGMPKATAAEKIHLERVKQLPCCACLPGEQTSITEVHHIVRSNKRLGHFHVLPLCQVHHRNVRKLRNLEKALWQVVMQALGVTGHEWPSSKVLPRRMG